MSPVKGRKTPEFRDPEYVAETKCGVPQEYRETETIQIHLFLILQTRPPEKFCDRSQKQTSAIPPTHMISNHALEICHTYRRTPHKPMWWCVITLTLLSIKLTSTNVR